LNKGEKHLKITCDNAGPVKKDLRQNYGWIQNPRLGPQGTIREVPNGG
jgi:hypothetical protein